MSTNTKVEFTPAMSAGKFVSVLEAAENAAPVKIVSFLPSISASALSTLHYMSFFDIAVLYRQIRTAVLTAKSYSNNDQYIDHLNNRLDAAFEYAKSVQAYLFQHLYHNELDLDEEEYDAYQFIGFTNKMVKEDCEALYLGYCRDQAKKVVNAILPKPIHGDGALLVRAIQGSSHQMLWMGSKIRTCPALKAGANSKKVRTWLKKQSPEFQEHVEERMLKLSVFTKDEHKLLSSLILDGFNDVMSNTDNEIEPTFEGIDETILYRHSQYISGGISRMATLFKKDSNGVYSHPKMGSVHEDRVRLYKRESRPVLDKISRITATCGRATSEYTTDDGIDHLERYMDDAQGIYDETENHHGLASL